MFVFVCWTPYQVFNAVNFVANDVEGSRGNTDIYIYHEFRNSEVISERLKASGVFAHVYDIDRYDKKRVWYSKFNKIKRLLMPYSTIRKYLRADIDVRKQGYKTLVISGNNLFSVNMYNCIQDLKVYFIDDGNGSYFGDLRYNGMTPIYRLFNKVFHRGPMSYKVEKFYVNNKEICKATICDTIVQLPTITPGSEVEEKLNFIFSYEENSFYKEKKFIYLTQPLSDTEFGESAREVENSLLSALKDKVVVRVHPLQKHEAYAEYEVDTTSNLWELECATQIKDDHVLIGWFSTAQFIPKMIFNVEPTVVFTYKLYEKILDEADETVGRLREIYTNPEKVVVLEDLSDLQKLVENMEVE